ncbi:MAG: hypothetical protein IT429_07560 [Gemmataceae bacterium]|nr:hypothetical protein [Gemmataceae bacterium]
MRNRWFLFASLLGLGIGLGVLVQRQANADDSDRVATLIKQLSSNKFTERDRAKRELEAIGVPALDALRKAVKNGDLEASRRAAELVRRMEGKIILDNLLAPKKVRLQVQDMPVPEAVAELAKQSGYTIDLLGDRVVLAGRKVTLDTGETTFWQAFDQLCAKASLVQVQSINNPYLIRPGIDLPVNGGIQILPVPVPRPALPPAKGQPAPPPANRVQPVPAIRLQIQVPNAVPAPQPAQAPQADAPAQAAPAQPAAPPAAPAKKAVNARAIGRAQIGRVQIQPAQAQPGQAQPGQAPAVQPLPARQIQIRPAPVQIQPVRPVIVRPQPAQRLNPSHLHVQDGKVQDTPTCYAGAIRIRVLPAQPKQAAAPVQDPTGRRIILPAQQPIAQRHEGEHLILLEVTGEPRLQNFQVAGPVQVDRALDDQDQKLTVPMDPMPEGRPGVGGGAVPAIGIVRRGYYYNPYLATNHVAVVRLKQGEKKAKLLKELAGHVPVQMLTPPETLINVENVLKAAGKKVQGEHGGAIEIIAIEKQGDGTYKVQCRFESPPNRVATNLPGVIQVIGNGQVQGIQIQIGGGVVGPAGRPISANIGNGLPVLVDAKGKSFQLTQIPARMFRGGINGVSTQEVTMIFRPRDGQGEPDRFVLVGQRPVTVQVPFTLQNVRLP